MMSSDKIADKVNFIFSECHRLQLLMQQDFKKIRTDDAFCMIPHPSGRGHMICGREAYRELQKLASLAAERAGMQRRVSLDKVTRTLGETLVTHFLNEGISIDDEHIKLALTEAVEKAAQGVADRMHFVPCHLMGGSEPSELSIGPVSFLSRKSFRKFIRRTLSEAKGLKRKQETNKLARDIMRDGLVYYRNFDWVARVPVIGCDEKEGRRLAKRAVTAALDCLHLILGGGATDKMRVGGPAISTDRRASIHQSAEGELRSSISRSWMGQTGFPEGWSEKLLLRDDVQRIFLLCGVTLEAAVNPDLGRPLSRRFLDATLWFGQGVREESLAAAVVKFVTALERMFMTEREGKIAAILAERLSAVCTIAYQGQNYKTRQQWYDETKKAYRLRSRLVHGSISPESDEVRQGVYSCMKLTEAALMSLLSLADEQALRREALTSKELTAMFGNIISAANNIEQLSSPSA